VAVGREHLGLDGEGKRWWVPMKVAFFVCCCSAAEMKVRRVDKWQQCYIYGINLRNCLTDETCVSTIGGPATVAPDISHLDSP
jgi:hypothetical protein